MEGRDCGWAGKRDWQGRLPWGPGLVPTVGARHPFRPWWNLLAIPHPELPRPGRLKQPQAEPAPESLAAVRARK